MYILISVTRESMDICESFYPTRDEAYQAMLEDILISTRYNTVDEVRRDAESDKCGLTDEDAWAETFSEGTCAWKIVKVPEETSMVSHTAHDKEDENAVDANGFEWVQEGDFTTKYATWIIAYCPDNDEFFATNQRSFFWQYTEEFASEKDAVAFFEGNVKKFISIQKEIRRKVTGDRTPSNRVWLSNTNKVYTEEV